MSLKRLPPNDFAVANQQGWGPPARGSRRPRGSALIALRRNVIDAVWRALHLVRPCPGTGPRKRTRTPNRRVLHAAERTQRPPPARGGGRGCLCLPLDLGTDVPSAQRGADWRGGDSTRVAVSNELHNRAGSHQAARAPHWRLIAPVLDERNRAFGTLAIRHKDLLLLTQKALGSSGLPTRDPVLQAYERPRSYARGRLLGRRGG